MRFEQGRAQGVALLPAEAQILVVVVQRAFLCLDQELEGLAHRQVLAGFHRRLARRRAVDRVDALREGLGVAHLVDGDQLQIGRERTVVVTGKLVVQRHVLVNRPELVGSRLVEHFDDALAVLAVLRHGFLLEWPLYPTGPRRAQPC